MFLPAALALLVIAQPAEKPKPFEFKDGDRIVWLGSTLVEREQRYGYWETALIAANPDKRLTVRNLGWSGDTVHGEARGRFDFADANKCFKQLVDQTLELKPTVIFIAYGSNESFEGKEGLPKFEKGLNKLLDALAPTKARVVLFSPMPFLSFGDTNVAERNKSIADYSTAIQGIATKRNITLADANKGLGSVLLVLEASRFDKPNSGIPPSEIAPNGIHLTELGYQKTADAFLKTLDLPAVSIETSKLEPLRQAVVAKNELFFHRWRPQNETYLFGFRKHEQGRNAKEIAEFDPFIAKAEDEIDSIRKKLK